MINKKKVLFVSSGGGHWVQMTKIIDGVDFYNLDVEIASVENVSSFKGFNVTPLPDFNKSQLIKTLRGAFNVALYILSSKPDVAISTGAAPGLVALLIVKLLGGKTIWIDSIANTEKLSLSGRLASSFCTQTLTQWPHLSDVKKNIIYKGRVV